MTPHPAHPEWSTIRPGIPHNVFAHPLLALVPPVGEWIHARTSPVVPTWRWRLAKRLGRW